MATKIARMDAVPVAQVTELTPTAANNTQYAVSINTKQLATYTSDASGTVQEIVEALQPLLELTTDSSTIPEATQIESYTENNLRITATGLSDGTPFTLTSTGAGTISVGLATASSSKNHWVAANFAGAGLPANGDTVYISQLTESQSIYYNLDQSAVTLAALNILADSSALIGLDEFDDLGYYQYRETHLKIGATVCRIGDGDGTGSRRIFLNFGTAQTAITIISTSSFGIGNDPPVHLIGTNADNTLFMLAGIVEIATKSNTTATFSDIRITGGTLTCGTGCTLGSLLISGNATVSVQTAAASITLADTGNFYYLGSGDITTLTHNGGICSIAATADITIATLRGYSGRVLNLSQSSRRVIVTDATIYASPDDPFTIIDPNNRLQFSNNWLLPNGAGSFVYKSGTGLEVGYI